jgi:hypothetical protein
MYSNYVIMECLKEAGLPDGVVQFIPGPAQETVSVRFLGSRPFYPGLSRVRIIVPLYISS